MKDDRGAMVLLTGVILIVGFLALAGMTSRVAQIPQEVELQRQNDLLTEVEAMLDGIQSVRDAVGDCAVAPSNDFLAALNQLEAIGRSRGLTVVLANAACDLVSTTEYSVDVAVATEAASMQMTFVTM